MEAVVGQRISYGDSGDLGFVRYVGVIPEWPEEVAVGIEWDESERGKNNGTLNGIRYFETVGNQKSGSFVKLKIFNKKKNASRSFIDALVYKYGNGDYSLLDGTHAGETRKNTGSSLRDETFPVIQMGSKKFESYGFTKLSAMQSDFSALEVISLDHLRISAFPIEDINLSTTLSSLADLDLSFNTISDFSFLVNLLSSFSLLRKVAIVGNRFENTTSYDSSTILKQVLDLNISFCDLKNNAKLIEIISTVFPNLERLNLSTNGLDRMDVLLPLTSLKNLKVLDLSFNKISKMDFKTLELFEHLKELNLSNNLIEINDNNNDSFYKLSNIVTLDLTSNKIAKWAEIDVIANQFPNLISIKILKNPLTRLSIDDKEKEEIDLIQLIGRLNSNLRLINGSDIPLKQRENYEVYFITKVKSGVFQFDNEPKWHELCDRYNVSHKINSKDVNEQSSKGEVILRMKALDKGIEFNQMIFPSFTIGKLRGKVSRRLDNIPSRRIHMVAQEYHEELINDQQLLGSYGFGNGDCIDIQIEIH